MKPKKEIAMLIPTFLALSFTIQVSGDHLLVPNPPGFTPVGNYMNGLGNLTESNAKYHKSIQEARILQQVAEKARMEVKLMWRQHYINEMGLDIEFHRAYWNRLRSLGEMRKAHLLHTICMEPHRTTSIRVSRKTPSARKSSSTSKAKESHPNPFARALPGSGWALTRTISPEVWKAFLQMAISFGRIQ